jgi:tetratricopeptide (TPR) repeat protein
MRKTRCFAWRATPAAAPYTEFLTYGFDDRRPDAATAFLQWENKRILFEIAVPNVTAIYVDTMRRELEGWPGFNYQNWQTAAQFCADNDVNLEEALVWADKAIREPFRNAAMGREDFSTLHTKADVLRALKRGAEADAVMARAIALPGTSAFELYGYGSQLLGAGSPDKALEVFTQSLRLHPDEPFWTHLGLARVYTASDKAKAIAEWELVLKNVPPSQRGNVPRFEQALQRLKAQP